MLLLRCSLPADSMSRSMSFWPSTIATRSSWAWVALNSMRFIFLSLPRSATEEGPGRPGPRIDELLQKSVLICVTEGELERGRFLLLFVGRPRGLSTPRRRNSCASSAYGDCVDHRSWIRRRAAFACLGAPPGGPVA